MPMPIPIGQTMEFLPTGSVQTITLPPAIYTIEAYGGQGGSYVTGSVYPTIVNNGGYGGHAKGSIILTQNTTLYIHVGQAAPNSNTRNNFNYADYGGGYRGKGGSTFPDKHIGGGGSSDVRLRSDNVLARLIVAGGGGGAGIESSYGHAAVGGNGGGTTGGDGQGYVEYGDHWYFASGEGGSQTSPGEGVDATAFYKGIKSENGDVFDLGYGGKAYSGADTGYIRAGSGGGGWHGGGGGIGDVRLNGTSGGGGSGYIYTSNTEIYYPTGCLLNRETDFLFDWEGTGLVNEESMHSGNGVVYITCQAATSIVPFYAKIDNAWVQAETAFAKVDGSWVEATSALAKVDNGWA